MGKENTYGTCVGLIKADPMSFARFSTDDTAAVRMNMSGRGDSPTTHSISFGGAGVVEIQQMQKLLRYICVNGFEHHVAANLSASLVKCGIGRA